MDTDLLMQQAHGMSLVGTEFKLSFAANYNEGTHNKEGASLMVNCCLILLAAVFISIELESASDVPFVFDQKSSSVADYTSAQLEQAYTISPDLAGVPSVSEPKDNEVLIFPVTGGGNTPGGKIEKKVADLKSTFDARVEPDNSVVRHEAVVLAARYSGDHTIDQISSIYTYLKNGDESKKGWSYVPDPRGLDYFMYANETLTIGKDAGCAGAGDCDDFAILMSALVESVGGTTRVILAHNNTTGGHAFTEVYVGKLNGAYGRVTDIIKWLEQKFNTNKIYTHVDTSTKDVWLNLDWGTDEKGNAHPGCPFYKGDKHIVLSIRDRYDKTPLNLPEESKRAESSEIPIPLIEAKPIDATKTTKPNQNEASNPAIAKCISLGNIYEDGKCTFPGGTSCDVWEFYRGNCVLAGKRHG